MKCTCDECGGSGYVECDECHGSGECSISIEVMKLHHAMPGYSQLAELKADAIRVREQARRLTEMNPARAESYAAQLDGCLSAINREAAKIAEMVES